jgi:hypothetical protein
METIEKTIVKINTKPVKDFIKTEVEKQKFYKNARKNATFTSKDGKIIWDPMHPSEAQSRVHFQSLELRIFYAAYALLRGKTIKDVEFKYDENDPNHFLNCRKLKIAKTLEGFKSMSQIKE